VEPVRHAQLAESDFLSVPEAQPSLSQAKDYIDYITTPGETPSHAILLGVAVMWVHAEHRRKGLAQHMISMACAQPSGMFFQFIGCTKKQVAFLAPTEDGTRFASRLRADGHVLRYNRYEDAAMLPR
jgi:hypothetical protein